MGLEDEWKNLVEETDKSLPDSEKLQLVNQFFNSKITYARDIDIWGTVDYWATPAEVLCKKAGDCEDFAIAKFFTLKELGVEEEKLSLMYVKALEYGVAHIVLAYRATPDPLILDNLIDDIVPLSKRPDLSGVLSFNERDLWLSGNRVAEKSSRIKQWRFLLKRM